MVCEWGMSDKLGPLAYEKNDGPVFLGMQNGQSQRDYSDAKAEEIDREIFTLITDGYERAKKILNDNLDKLHILSEALLEYETIDGEEVEMVCQGASLDEVRTRRKEVRQRLDAEAKEEVVMTKAKSDEDSDSAKTSTGNQGGNPGPVTA